MFPSLQYYGGELRSEMQILRVTVLALHLSVILCKRKYRDSSSEESIENLLYYQDCNHKKDQPATTVKLRGIEPYTTQKPQECKMCCSMCCGEECEQNNSCNPRKQQQPRQPFKPVKKIEPDRPPRPHIRNPNPLFARRDFGLTKDNIKSLISQDTDIRKILKDLVRVTMQKVDLMQLLSAKRLQNKPVPKDSEDENDL